MTQYLFILNAVELGYDLDWEEKCFTIQDLSNENVSKIVREVISEFLSGKIYNQEEVDSYLENLIDNGKFKEPSYDFNRVASSITFQNNENDIDDKLLRIKVRELELY